MKKRIVIFDDNDSRREGLELLINMTEDFESVGTFSDCRNVLANIEQYKPDVVLMDIDMPNVNGIEGVIAIRKKNKDLKILMQTVFEDDEKIFQSICAGADGYILKKAHPSELLKAISEVLTGGAPMTPSIARQVLKLVNNPVSSFTKKEFHLTDREIEILDLLVQGMSYKMIAEKCFISRTTVNTHVQHIFEKLQVHNVAGAVSIAKDNKIV